jgi:3-oxoacyl-[acyl-carrier protein] reductase
MNKIVLITGASKGVGKSMAISLSKKKYKLILVSRNLLELKKLKIYININLNNKNVELISGDVSNKKLPKKIFNFCKKKFGLPDILINNCGGPPSGNFNNFNINDWEKVISTNLFSVINFSKVFSKNMIKKKWGRIVTISSLAAKEPSSNMVLSSTVRSGVSAFSKSISFELAKNKITVNTILLGGVETDRLKSLIKKNSKIKGISYKAYKNKIEKSIPLQRFADPNEISDLVEFLLTEKGSYITGQNIIIDGGLSKSI